ncbi:unnamed protein product [Didymodactylos carnosus]|nr:unnamed protein product [Didymodactylos carnosus]CAF3581768.1 unnamed protein product [Didymodactylos carnosus]
MTEKESSKIEEFFCHRCRFKTPTLRIKYTLPQKEAEEKLHKVIQRPTTVANDSSLQERVSMTNMHINPHTSNDIYYDSSNSDSSSALSSSTTTTLMKPYDSSYTHSNQSLINSDLSTSNQIQTVQYETLEAKLDTQSLFDRYSTIKQEQKEIKTENDILDQTKQSLLPPPPTKRSGNKGETTKRKRSAAESNNCTDRSNNYNQADHRRYSSRHRCDQSEEWPRQCFGPGCVHEARTNSKYCSDECGLELARNRLLQFLPMRMMCWQAIPSTADVLNLNALEDIKLEIDEIKRRLVVLDDDQRKLDDIVEKGRKLKAIKDANKLDPSNEEPDWTCFCILCNQEVSQKSYMRHIDKCFIRYESQVSYGSNVKSNIEGLFCDHYDPTNQLYCKRLKVICPEHSRDPKIGLDEACGCPIEKNLFDVSDELCIIPKRTCTKHLKWDRKRRAQIDLERLHELMRLEELVEKENRLRSAVADRGSVAGLLMHKTIPH